MTYNNHLSKLAVMAVLGAACALSACSSSSNNPTPGEDAGTKKGTAGKAAAKDGGSAGKGDTAGKGGTGGSSGGAGGSSGGAGGSSGGAGGSGGSSSTDCAKDSAKDCFTCDKPSTDEQFLNHCTAATCTAYDNSKLSKLGANGKLPALP